MDLFVDRKVFYSTNDDRSKLAGVDQVVEVYDVTAVDVDIYIFARIETVGR